MSDRAAKVVLGDEPRNEPAYNDDGVDLTQIRRSLARSPLDRLAELEDGIRMLEELERARERLKVR